eukprot:1436219-Amphidinium_carterae.1
MGICAPGMARCRDYQLRCAAEHEVSRATARQSFPDFAKSGLQQQHSLEQLLPAIIPWAHWNH